ncbi:MAG: hypothetical protein AABZ55_05710 [Bdellovibrionota bacterium]
MIWLLSLTLSLPMTALSAEPPQGTLLVPDQIEILPSSEAKISVVIEESGLRIPLQGLKFREPEGHCTEEKKTRKILTYLSNPWFRIVHDFEVYRIEFDAPCTSQITVLFQGGSLKAQTLLIWNVAMVALSKLETEVGLEFWRTPLIWVWPATNDSYSHFRLFLTYPTNVEVITHEMGHAVYDFADIGAFQAGEHRFESCTDSTLALTEGWASFFAAWILFDRSSLTPTFHHLVPRFESVGIENIPASVCQGPTSEWRVIGFLWDLIDHPPQDDDRLNLSFGEVFKILKDTRKASIDEVYSELKLSQIDATALKDTWDLNFTSR